MNVSAIEKAKHLILSSNSIVSFTGAGISTECGIPDFRSPGGLWTKFAPIPFDQFLKSEQARLEAWRRKLAIDDEVGDVLPGTGHKFIDELFEQDRLSSVITQNIDGLHRHSGVLKSEIIELHGTGKHAVCLECETRHEIPWARDWIEEKNSCPRCLECGGFVKSATISFGQRMPAEQMELAHEESLNADLFLVMGSSLSVRPAATFPEIAQQNGCPLIIVNREKTPLDDLAEVVYRGEISSFVDQISLKR